MLLPALGVAPAASASRRATPGSDEVGSNDLMQPTFRAAPMPPPTPLESTLRHEEAQLAAVDADFSVARARHEHESLRLRRASVARLRSRGVSVDVHSYNLAALHAWERRLAGGSQPGLADGDALLVPGTVPWPKLRRRTADADGILSPGTVAMRARSASFRLRDPDALLPLGYAARSHSFPDRRSSLRPDGDAPMRW